jgi:hypothetical protein
MKNTEAFELAKRKARYGHRDWVVYKDRDGEFHAAQMSSESVKAAMLATGTKSRWHVIAGSTAVGHIQNWALGVLLLRNMKYHF